MKAPYTKFYLGHEFGYDQATIEITDLGEIEQGMHRIVIPVGFDSACLLPEFIDRLDDGRISIACCTDFLS